MASDIDQPALDYLLTSQRAEVVIKKFKIGEKSYKYERSKPLSGKLMKELKKARQKMNYKLYNIRKTKSDKWININKNKKLTGVRQETTATTIEETSAFKNYANSISSTHMDLRGIQALELLIEQENRIEQFLNENKGMKIIVDIIGVFREKMTDDLTKQHQK